jgi:amino acid adenylation domain-containing protein
MDYNLANVKYIKSLLLKLNDDGISVEVTKDQLILEGPLYKIDEESRKQIQSNKQNIIAFISELKLRQDASEVQMKRKTGDFQPLSFTQQRLWIVDKLNEGSFGYNMPMAFRVEGKFAVDVAEKTLEEIVNRHEILRTVYHEQDGSPYQRILPPQKVSITRHNLTKHKGEIQNNALWEIIVADSQKTFDLKRNLMLRASFVLLKSEDAESAQSGVIVFNIHHIASDGWSMEVLVKEFMALYLGFVNGEPALLKPLPVQYADFSNWQRDTFQGQILDSELRYWEEQLKDAPLLHGLVLDKPRPASKQFVGEEVVTQLSASVAHGLQKLAQRYELTPFMLLHGALALVLSRHSNHSDIIIGTPVANRMQPELAGLIGCFVNTLALRVNTEHSSLAEYYAHVREVNLAAQSNQNIPFEQVVEHLNVPRSAAHSPLIQIILDTSNNYGVNEQPQQTDTQLAGATFTPLRSDFITTKFDLDLELILNSNGVINRWKYDVALFDDAHIRQLNHHLCNLLEGLSKLGSLDVSSDSLTLFEQQEEQTLLKSLNGAAVEFEDNTCIHQQFELQVLCNGDKTAVICEGQSLSYSQLNQKANHLAHYLRNMHGIGPDSLVGLFIERSVDMMVTILAVLKAGGAYVPLDPCYPKGRLQQIVEDAQPVLIVANKAIPAEIDFASSVVCLDSEQFSEDASKQNVPLEESGVSPSNLAYVIYTSGSTGRPKGVMLEHRSVMNYLSHVQLQYMQDGISGSVVSTSLNFDATVTSIFGPLLMGKTVELLRDDQNTIQQLHTKLITSRDPLLFKLTPVHLSALLDLTVSDESCSAQHIIVVGGEALLPATITQLRQQLLPQATFINEYGPTEATVGCTVFTLFPQQKEMATIGNLSKNAKSVPIGKGIQNTEIRLLDGSYNLVPQGAIGELYIGGVGLARGYLKQPQMTADRFIDWHYTSIDGHTLKQRLYKTGDLAKILPDGNLEFVGRKDNQVKVRGFRIELGDIEYHLSSAPDVDSGVVLLDESDVDNKHLKAFVKLGLTREASADLTSTETQQSNIWTYLKNNLPAYMMPNKLVIVDAWPIMQNGKIDKATLLTMDNKNEAIEQYEAPLSQTEIELKQIWAELLHLDVDAISVNQNLLKLGGDSLLIIRMMVQIKKHFDVKPELEQIYKILTIRELAIYVNKLVAIKVKEESMAEETVQEEGWL